MKKCTLLLSFCFLLLVIGVFISGCASLGYQQDLGIYNPFYPEEQLATLNIAAVLRVVSFNGRPVQWTSPLHRDEGHRASLATAHIKIPAGRHEIIANYYFRSGGSTLTAEDLKITFDFVAGQTYDLNCLFRLKQTGIPALSDRGFRKHPGSTTRL